MIRDFVFTGPNKEAAWKYWMDQIPQRRVIPPSEVAGPVVFLLSDASASITGSNLVVDAGMTAQLVSTEPKYV